MFAFLSEYEGFGLTPLEALAAGVPPVVLDTPVARETCGAAARYVAPSAIERRALRPRSPICCRTPTRAATSCASADDVLARYDWSVAAAATLSVLEEAAGGR